MKKWIAIVLTLVLTPTVLTGGTEMTMSQDRKVQIPQYGNDLKVVANFFLEGVEVEEKAIPAQSLLIMDREENILYTPQV